MTARYQIEQSEDGRWYILNSRDHALGWAGSHWYFIGEAGPPLTTFADRAAAEKYARVVLGGGEK
jgi:hypothetical protein